MDIYLHEIQKTFGILAGELFSLFKNRDVGRPGRGWNSLSPHTENPGEKGRDEVEIATPTLFQTRLCMKYYDLSE
jgi:hypothetical protein